MSLGLEYVIIFVVANIIGSGVYKKYPQWQPNSISCRGYCWPELCSES